MKPVTTTTAWTSFLPDHVAREIAEHPIESLVGRAQRFKAVTLFADVSGFTPMSEALGKTGKRGTEELTSILNAFFEPTIELIHSFGGTVGKFAGDALMVLFPYARGSVAQGAARRAIQCALDMQAGMRRYEAIETSAGSFSLTVKVGLALGPVLSVTVGDPRVRLEYVLAGRALDLCADAEHHASAGEIVAHEDVLDPVADVEIVETRGSFKCLSGLKERARRVSSRPVEDGSAAAGAVVARYLHPSLAARLDAGQWSLINEHRRVTVLFARFEELDYDHDPEAATKLQRYVEEVIRTIDRYGGYLRQIDMGDKGSKYIALFGAPIAHENDPERAVHCALDLHGLSPLASAIGINTGLVFCGRVGSDARQEYAVMGDAVNVAARLMQASELGETVVSDTTQRHTVKAFVWEPLPPLRLKGKSEPVQVFAPRGSQEVAHARLHEPSYLLPMVGRGVELGKARAAVGRVVKGRGQILGITGEAGIGKSRLVAEVAELAAGEGLIVHGGACQSYGANTSYLVWRDVWRAFFGIDSSGADPSAVGEQLERELASIGKGLGERAPLLSSVLNVPLPENDLTESLEPELRTESLKDLLLTCLRHRAEQAPLLLVLEDCHWIDAMSQELIEFLGRNLGDLPILLVPVYRTPEGDKPGPISWAGRRPNCGEIALGELTPTQIESLIRLKLGQLFPGQGGPPPALVERVTGQAGGNPFYIEEILNFLRDRGIEVDDVESLARLELPDSLHNLIMARIDTLGEAEKATLKLASVLGRLFKASWVWGSFPELGSPTQVKGHLDLLSRLDLTPLDKPGLEPEYIFKHVTTQEVAYDSLGFGTRETLHESVGRFIEDTYADGLAQYLDVLAHHYGSSTNKDKQRTYFRQAGDAAKATFANEAAIGYYRRLLPLLTGGDETDVLLGLGEVLQLVGDWTDAEDLFRRALTLAEEEGAGRDLARSRAALGTLLSHTRPYDEAATWLEQAREEFERLGDRPQESLTLRALGYTYLQGCDYDRARSYSLEHMRLATQIGDQVGESAAAENLGLVYRQQGDYGPALEHLEQALSIARDIDDKRRITLVMTDLAGVHAEGGEYVKAVERLDEGFAIASEIGDQWAAGLFIANAGELCVRQGDYARALTYCKRAMDIAAELGDRTGVLDTVGRVGTICAAEGRHADAERLLDHAIALSRNIKDRWFLCESILDKARLLARRERLPEAESLTREAIEVADAAGRQDVALPARLLLSRLEVGLGTATPDHATAKLNEMLGQCSAEAERAAVHYTLWCVDGSRDESRRAAARLYRNLYGATPNVDYRRRYEKLTGELLPDPPPMPPVAEGVASEPVSIDTVIDQAEVISSDAL